MPYTVEPTSARTWSDEQMDALFAAGFPGLITADRSVKPWIGRVRELFTHLDVILVDAEGEPAATGWGVPIGWDGKPETLPSTFGGLLQVAVENHDARGPVDTLVIAGGVVHPRLKGSGVAVDLVNALIDTGVGHGLATVVAPVRPTLKHRYPLVPIEHYVGWRIPDGQPFDPWLRLHLRLGGQVVALSPAAQTMTGTVEQWQTWTGLALPGSGQHIIPDGMSTLHVDLEADLGTYVEPNIWVRHR